MGTARAMTNNPADAFDPMRFALQCIRSICKDSPRNGQTWHDIDEIAANALSAAKTDRDGWMPIESAPKDTPVLVFVPVNRPERRILLCHLSDDCGWGITGGAVLLARPTYWQPLPSAPVKQEGKMG